MGPVALQTERNSDENVTMEAEPLADPSGSEASESAADTPRAEGTRVFSEVGRGFLRVPYGTDPDEALDEVIQKQKRRAALRARSTDRTMRRLIQGRTTHP